MRNLQERLKNLNFQLSNWFVDDYGFYGGFLRTKILMGEEDIDGRRKMRKMKLESCGQSLEL